MDYSFVLLIRLMQGAAFWRCVWCQLPILCTFNKMACDGCLGTYSIKILIV